MNPLGAISVVASMAAFAFAQSRLGGRSFRTRAIALIVLGPLSIPSMLFAVYYLHLLPDQAWFYTLRSWMGTEFLVVFLGAAGGAAAALLPRFLTILPLFVSFTLAVIPYLKPLMMPLPDDAFHEQWEGDACLQSTASTCGPASTATILKSLGVHASEREIARAAYSYLGGTEAWYLSRFVRSRGLCARFDFKTGFQPSVGLPAVVGVRLGDQGHFIAVLRMDGDQVTFADPLNGIQQLPLTAFRRKYRFTGFHMIVARS